MSNVNTALKMAIELLSQDSKFFSDPREYVEAWDKALNACKEALESQEQEPVALLRKNEHGEYALELLALLENVEQGEHKLYFGDSCNSNVRADSLSSQMRNPHPAQQLSVPKFPTMLRKMWSGTEVQEWIDKNIHPAQPLSDDEISKLFAEFVASHHTPSDSFKVIAGFARAIEAHHGIGVKDE